MQPPKAFISYSWTTPEFEVRVVDFATELRQSGVDIILDKWDLREGHDAHAFMERIVTDPEIKKVILVCDRGYARKTDGRHGGVGKEAQIITGEIYKAQAQDKFVAVVMDREDDGAPCLPAYYRSRIYIDLSDPARYAENFERLLRWIYDKPLYLKPELGNAPAFLSETGAVALATSTQYRRAIDAVRTSKPHAVPAVAEYFGSLVREFEQLRMPVGATPIDEAVLASIEAFRPYRNEATEIFLTIASHLNAADVGRLIHAFFEQLLPYLSRPHHIQQWNEWDFDNYCFIIHELFLYAVAALLRFECFEAVSQILSAEYYVPRGSEYGTDLNERFTHIRGYMKSLEYRKQRLQLNRLSIRADLLEQRSAGSGIEFRHVMQADFVLFLRAKLDKVDDLYWWPETLLYVGRVSGPFEIFARARSAAYFNKIKVLLGIGSKQELEQLLQALAADSNSVPRWQHEVLSVRSLLGVPNIETRP